jgi:hypothetical protein
VRREVAIHHFHRLVASALRTGALRVARRREAVRLGLAFLAGLCSRRSCSSSSAPRALPGRRHVRALALRGPVAGLLRPAVVAAGGAAKVVVPARRRTNATLLRECGLHRRTAPGCHGKFGARSPWGNDELLPARASVRDEGSTLGPAEMFVAVKHGIRGTGMRPGRRILRRRDLDAGLVSPAMRALPPAVDQAWKVPPQ